MFESEEEEISERVYNSDEDEYIIKTRAKAETKAKTAIKKTKTKSKTETKDIIKTETETGIDIDKTEPFWVFGDKFKKQIGLQTQMNKHMRESVISNDLSFADNYTIKSSFNQSSYILLSRVVILLILMSL